MKFVDDNLEYMPICTEKGSVMIPEKFWHSLATNKMMTEERVTELNNIV